MREPGRRFISVAVLALAVALPHGLAQDPSGPANDPRVREVAGKLTCYCGCSTQSIAECTCGVATKSRAEILASLEAGASAQEVVDDWVDRFGTRILLEPPRRGFNLLGYFLPAAVLLLMSFVLLLVIRKWRLRTAGPALAPAPGDSPPDPRYLEQLERDLKSMKP